MRRSAQRRAAALFRIALAAGLAAAAFGLALSVPAGAARAEQAWVRGEIRLNLRSGPGTQFRILGSVVTGDPVTILARGDGWTQVRVKEGEAGWIPAGYLEPQPPPTVRLQQLETETASLRERLEATTTEATALREENEQLAGADGQQRGEIERLTLENMELRAGARWPEWIAGATIVCVGMLIGAMLHRNATRRPNSRIRL